MGLFGSWLEIEVSDLDSQSFPELHFTNPICHFIPTIAVKYLSEDDTPAEGT